MNIASNIREIRLQKGITQDMIADALNLDTSVVSNIEKGKRELRVFELEIIANVLGEDVVYLITYPKRYIDSATVEGYNTLSSSKVSVTFEVPIEKRQMLMDLLGHRSVK